MGSLQKESWRNTSVLIAETNLKAKEIPFTTFIVEGLVLPVVVKGQQWLGFVEIWEKF